MKINLVVLGVLVSSMCATGILTAQQELQDEGSVSEVQVEMSADLTDPSGDTVPADAVEDLDDLDDMDDEISDLDDLDDELDAPVVSPTDDLDELDLPGENPNKDAMQGESDDTESAESEDLLDPADAEQMRQLQIDISIHPADVIMLRNGETVEGVIQKKTEDFVLIENETGLQSYPLSEIEFTDEISEKERFYLFEKIQALQAFNKRTMEKKLAKKKQELLAKKEQAEAKTESLNRLTGKDDSGLYNLTHARLEEILKDFSQFPPDYWRYYQRKHDAQKAILQLRRLSRYAHEEIVALIGQYIKAFETKIKELNEPEGSRLISSYKDNYKRTFSTAEQRRNVLKGTGFH